MEDGKWPPFDFVEVRVIHDGWIWEWVPIHHCLAHVNYYIKVKYNVKPKAAEWGGVK